MFRDEVPPSIHALDQAWFSMLLVNDPNTALIGSLRPARQHSLWAVLRRPFERRAPLALEVGDGVEEMRGWRPHSLRWIGAGLLLALGVGFAGVKLDTVRMAAAEAVADSPGERLAPATPPVTPIPSLPLALHLPGSGTPAVLASHNAAAAIVAKVVPLAAEPNAQVLAKASAALRRSSKTSEASVSSAKRRPAARRSRRHSAVR